MKTIRRVAGTELRTLFYSPIAWFVLVVFLIQAGIVYFNSLDAIATQQEMGGIRLRYLYDLMGRLFVGKSALFSNIMQNLYLFIPLLTMGLISRETSSGTIRLLYSSPIKVREIIMGKYLAMVIYSLLMVAAVSIFVILGISQVKNADKGMLITSLIGLYLLLCTYSAIGLFMSCLTTYQIVAAVCTFVMIGALSYIGTVWQGIEFVRDITYYLSISGRTEKMLHGLITSKDVIYYLVIIYIFLGLSILKIRSGMESKPAMVKAGRYLAVVASGILVGYISSLPSFIGYYDATSVKSNTVRPNVQQIIAEFGDEPLEVTGYNNTLGGASSFGGAAFHNTFISTWELYQRFKKGHNIKINKIINYYDSTLDTPYMLSGFEGKTLKEIAEHMAKATGQSMRKIKSPEEMRKIIDLRPELNRFVMQLKYKNRTTFLRIFDDQMVWPSETEVAAAFKRLLSADLPRVAFLTGNLERNIFRRSGREYMRIANSKPYRFSLVNQGFEVDTVSLETRDVPEDVDILVIADPKQEFTEATLARLKKYISQGGNLLITAEPYKNSPLQPLLKEIGVELMDGQVVEADKDNAPNNVNAEFTDFIAGFSKAIKEFKQDTLGPKPAMTGVAALKYTVTGGFDIQPWLLTNPKTTWNRMKELDPEIMTSALSGNSMVAMPESEEGEDKVTQAPVAPRVVPTTNNKPAIAPKEQPNTNDIAAEDRKKKFDSVRKVLEQIKNEPGSEEEKQKKMMEVMSNLEKANPLSPAQKKTRDSVQLAINTIMTGSGTQEEKQKAVGELLQKINRQSVTTAPTNMNKPATKPQQVKSVQEPVRSTGSAVTTAVENAGKRKLESTITFSPADGDVRGPFALALSLSRKINGKEQRILVTGDADFIRNNSYNDANAKMGTTAFSWLAYGEYPIDSWRPSREDNRITINSSQVSTVKILVVWLLPAAIIVFASILLIRRKRK